MTRGMRSARYAVVMPETSAVHGGRRDAPARGLLGPADVRGLVRALGIRPAKARGQNFVHDAGTVRRIVRRAGVRPGEDVLEIGLSAYSPPAGIRRPHQIDEVAAVSY